MRTFLRRAFRVGILAGLAYGIWRLVEARRRPSEQQLAWEAQPFPYPPVPRVGHADEPVHVPTVVTPGGGPETDAAAVEEPWMAPVDGTCPPSHPVKAKLASGIFHVPGGANYERTKPDRCYCDPEAAAADGLRPSKV